MTIFLILALICFGLATFNVQAGPVNLTAAGLFFFVLSSVAPVFIK